MIVNLARMIYKNASAVSAAVLIAALLVFVGFVLTGQLWMLFRAR